MNRQTGFTLLELMIVVAIAGILLAVGAPSFQNITINNRIASNTNEFITALNLARSEAVKRAAPVSACKSADGATCATSGDWDQGWIVRVDADNEVLRVFGALGGDSTLESDEDIVTYTALGGLDDAVEFELAVGKDARQKTNCISINIVGRARVEGTSCD